MSSFSSPTFRFILLYLTLLSIGTGSWLFHMTLRYDMQLMDEVPMVFGSATLTYCIYQVRCALLVMHFGVTAAAAGGSQK